MKHLRQRPAHSKRFEWLLLGIVTQPCAKSWVSYVCCRAQDAECLASRRALGQLHLQTPRWPLSDRPHLATPRRGEVHTQVALSLSGTAKGYEAQPALAPLVGPARDGAALPPPAGPQGPALLGTRGCRKACPPPSTMCSRPAEDEGGHPLRLLLSLGSVFSPTESGEGAEGAGRV